MEESQAPLMDLSGYREADLIEAYRILYDKAEEIKQQAKVRTAKLNEGMKLFQTELFRRMNEAGHSSITVENVATAFKKRSVYVSVNDWDLFYGHIADRIKAGEPPADVLSAFHKKASVEYVETWTEEHEGILPPGSMIHVEQVLSIRRLK